MRVEELERELRAERPEPESDFSRRLDDWAAAGFPRERGLGPRAGSAGRVGRLTHAWEKLRSSSPRRLLMPVGAAATFFVIAALVIVQGGDESGSGLSGGDGSFSSDDSVSAMESSGESASAEKAIPEADGAAATQALGQADTARDSVTTLPAPPSPGGGGIARGTENRIIDATAQLRLGAEADEVQEVANEVVAVTDRHSGVVLDSQVTSDQDGARAAFTLEIPYKQLDAALTDLSELADVISRTEAGEDITARAVRARKDLAEIFDRIRQARIELIEADSREERLIIKAQINSLQASADAASQQLNNVKRQGRFATVDVEITSSGPGSDEGDWSLGDALDDAVRVIEVIGGIALVSLAVIVPLALVAAIAWLIAARARSHQRERALVE